MAAKAKVLVISSDSALLRFIERNLNINLWDIASTQHTGEEMTAVIHSENPALVILDIMMPGMEGLEVCLRLRQLSGVPVMMLSTWGAGRDMVRGLDLGAVGYLTDPFGIDGLRARINQAMGFNVAAAEHPEDIRSITW